MALKPLCKHGLLLRAIAASLLLHVVILLQPVARERLVSDHAGSALHALLVPAATRTPAPVRSESQSALGGTPSRRVLAREVPHESHAARESIPATVATAQPAPKETASAASDAESASESQSIGMAAPSNRSGTTASVTGAAPAGAAFAEAKTAYLFALAAEARRAKRYPRRALLAGWSGMTRVNVRVELGGVALAPRLRQSSGYAEIDQAALTMVETALKNTPVPESLKDQAFEFVLPVTFSLDER